MTFNTAILAEIDQSFELPSPVGQSECEEFINEAESVMELFQKEPGEFKLDDGYLVEDAFELLRNLDLSYIHPTWKDAYNLWLFRDTVLGELMSAKPDENEVHRLRDQCESYLKSLYEQYKFITGEPYEHS